MSDAPATSPWSRHTRRVAWGLAALPWLLIVWGPVLAAFDREWFTCSSLSQPWFLSASAGLVVMGASALYGLFGVILASEKRAPFAAGVLSPLALAAVVVLLRGVLTPLFGSSSHEYCGDDGRFHSLGSGELPVRRGEPAMRPGLMDRSCSVDADCMAWPSGCCAWLGLNRADTRPPGPGAACEMACRQTPSGARCMAGQCEAIIGGAGEAR